nr:glycosyltransferase [Lewinella sp. JB7]
MVARDHTVTVVAVQEDPGLPCGERELHATTEEGYQLVQVYYGRPDRSHRIRNLLYRAIAYRFALAQLTVRPDLIHGHITLDGGIVAALLAKWYGVPHVISEHSSAYRSPEALSTMRSLLCRWACRRAMMVLPVSVALSRGMVANGLEGNYAVVPNVVDTDLFRPTPRGKAGPFPEAFRLLHVSNFDARYKNVEGILDAYARLYREEPGAYHLTIAGDGDVESVKQLAAAAALAEDSLTISGPHTQQEVAHLMQGADLFVLFSNYETQGIVLLEALSSGLPVVATWVGGIPEIVHDCSLGVLLESGDTDALVDTIRLIATGQRTFDSGVLRNSSVRRYGEDAVMAKINQVYERIRLEP